MTRLVIEFPMSVLASYHGPGNLDTTIDDEIRWFLIRPFSEAGADFEITMLGVIDAVPEDHDSLYRFELSVGAPSSAEAVSEILDSLGSEAYDRGATIRAADGSILHSDEFTPDIQERRRIQSQTRA